MCGSRVRGAMLREGGAWPLAGPDLHSLRRNDGAVIGQICSEKPIDVATVRSDKLLARLEIDDLDVFSRERGLL